MVSSTPNSSSPTLVLVPSPVCSHPVADLLPECSEQAGDV